MDWEQVIVGVGAALSTTRGFGQWWATRGARTQIKHDLELWSLLPTGESKDLLMRDIDQRVVRFIEDRRDRRLDPYAWFWVVVFIALFAWTLWLGIKGKDWWFWLSALLFFFNWAAITSAVNPKRSTTSGKGADPLEVSP